jgi:DNA-binding MurR/RpiR family transcriptional regulator
MLQRRTDKSPRSRRFIPNAQPIWSGAGAADLFADRLREKRRGLSSTMARVVRYIEQNRVAVLASSAAQIARRTGTSDATVIRTVQALGFASLAEMRQELVADLERGSPVEAMSRTLKETGESADRAIELVLDTHIKGLDQLRRAQPNIAEAIGRLDRAARIVIFGVGPTALLADYAAFTLRRSGRQVYALNRTGIELADQLLDLRPPDVLLVLAYGRAYPEVVCVFDEAERLQIPIVLITDSLAKELADRAQLLVPVTRGDAGQAALHGVTLVCLEAIVIGLAAVDDKRSLTALDQLMELRRGLGGRSAD